MDLLPWLLQGDPAVVWQAQRDVAGLPARDYQSLRAAVAEQGWGAALLAARGGDGLWAEGWYGPKWTSTFYTLQTLSLLGLPEEHAEARASVDLVLERAVSTDRRGRRPGWAADICVAGMLIRTAVRFGFRADPRVAGLVDYLLQQQLPDGGWNCTSIRAPVAHSSFHSTLSVLEGLHEVGEGEEAQQAGREFLLAHRLFRSHRTGEVVHREMLSFSFPRYWYYDVLRSLEHFADAGAPRDPRASDGIELLQRRRRSDGTWALGRTHRGETWLTMEHGGRPSRMITLSALRVLRWWDAQSPEPNA